MFGKNVDTVEGEEWQRHRKITTPPFNERNSGLVWKESLRQAEDMIKEWSAHREQGVNTTNEDMRTLALHVLTSAGFGVVFIIVFPRKVLSSSFAPKTFRRLSTAIQEFETYMTEMVNHERMMISKRDPGTGNLLSSLIRASDQAKENALTEDEIRGNTFIYSFAGHETTANTLAYAISLLAVYPKYQDWIHQ
ncbi:hypothetical protein P7C71_g6603, partial [Lecanoromycetidae sp. Uapishka_2]